MSEPTHQVEQATTRGGLPVSPSMGPTLRAERLAAHPPLVDRRVFYVSVAAIIIAIAAGAVAEGLLRLIGLITNLSFYGRVSDVFLSPADNHLGLLVIGVPVIGGLIVGLMARYGSEGIRGHGIPEAMEQVLVGQSRVPARLTFLKPLSAAIAIGTGGPFGAEGPIIATGGAMGSVLGQLFHTTAAERKALLASGAAAGMAATFGSPVSATLMAVELLLFEFRPRSFIPVALACTAAAGMRFWFHQKYPLFDMPKLEEPEEFALLIYILIGAVVGLASVFVTRAVYAVEDGFALLPIHWMWWPAIGAVAVGIIGYFAPRTLGVGYYNISDAISAKLTLGGLAMLCALKFTSWTIALGSGTSGGTLAPLFTIGASLGALLGAAAGHLLPGHGIDLRIAALVGMASLFAGASRALLTSVVFAFETTHRTYGLLPLLGGCSAAYFVSCALMQNTIMTTKVTRHGVRVPAEFVADFLDQVLVGDVATRKPVTLPAGQSLGDARRWLAGGARGASHHGFPVVDENQRLVGVLTRADLIESQAPQQTPLRELITRAPLTVFPDSTLREAADQLVSLEVGRLAVVDNNDPAKLIGILTRADVLSAHRRRLNEVTLSERSLDWRNLRPNRRRPAMEPQSESSIIDAQ